MLIYILYNQKHEPVEAATTEWDLWNKFLENCGNPMKSYFSYCKRGYYILTKEI